MCGRQAHSCVYVASVSHVVGEMVPIFIIYAFLPPCEAKAISCVLSATLCSFRLAFGVQRCLPPEDSTLCVDVYRYISAVLLSRAECLPEVLLTG